VSRKFHLGRAPLPVWGRPVKAERDNINRLTQENKDGGAQLWTAGLHKEGERFVYDRDQGHDARSREEETTDGVFHTKSRNIYQFNGGGGGETEPINMKKEEELATVSTSNTSRGHGRE